MDEFVSQQSDVVFTQESDVLQGEAHDDALEEELEREEEECSMTDGASQDYALSTDDATGGSSALED